MNLQMLMIAKRSIMDQLDDLIHSIDKDTREGLTIEDLKFMRSLLIDLNLRKDKILKIYYRGIYGDGKYEIQ